jgi:hypothetical protein
MKQTTMALVAVLLFVGLCSGAMAEGIPIEGNVSNNAPVLSDAVINSTLKNTEGKIAIDSEDGVNFWAIAVVVDNNGIDTISSVTYELFDPTNTLVDSGSMNLLADPTDALGIKGVAEVDLFLEADAAAGTYTLEITATDEELSNSTSVSAEFTNDKKFTFTPLLLNNLEAGNTVSASFWVKMNYGETGEEATIGAVTIGDMNVTKEGLADDVIPAANIIATPQTLLFGVGDSVEIIVSIDVPYGTHGGTLSGNGTMLLSTNT